MGLKTKYKSTHRNDKGTVVFVHEVSGNADELAAYEAAQGEFFRKDDVSGKALFFDVALAADTGKLGISEKTGNVYVDTSDFDRDAAAVAAAGGDLGAELAKAYAQKYVMGGVTANVAIPAPAVIEDSSDEEPNI
jgi:hypothetical protein